MRLGLINRYVITWLWNSWCLDTFLLASVALAITLPELGKNSLWLDEAWTLHWALPETWDIAQRHATKSGHPPVYAWMMAVWVDVFGQGEYQVRLSSVLFHILTVPLIYAAGRVVSGSRWVGMIAAILYVTSPMTFYHARDLKQYSLVALIASVMLLLSSVGLRHHVRHGALVFITRNWSHFVWWWGAALSAFLLAAIHYTGILSIVVAATMLLVLMMVTPRYWKVLLINFITTFGITALVYYFIFGSFITNKTGDVLLQHFGQQLMMLYGNRQFPFAVLVVLGLLSMVIFQMIRSRDYPWLLMLCAFAFMPILAFVGLHATDLSNPMFKYRTFIWVLPALMVLMALGLHHVRPKWLFAVLVALLLTFNVWGTVKEFGMANEPWREAVATVADEYQAGDIMMLCHMSHVYPVLYYSERHGNLRDLPIYTPKSRGNHTMRIKHDVETLRDWSSNPQRPFVSAHADAEWLDQHERIWILTRHGRTDPKNHCLGYTVHEGPHELVFAEKFPFQSLGTPEYRWSDYKLTSMLLRYERP